MQRVVAHSVRIALFLSAAAVVALSGCASEDAGELLIAEVPSDPSSQPAVGVIGVEPGAPLEEGTPAIDDVIAARTIATPGLDGLTRVNSLARVWDATTLFAYRAGATDPSTPGAPPGIDVVATGDSADSLDEVTRSASASTTLLRRGAFVQDSDSCVLASGEGSVEPIDDGICRISSDERWVASWEPGVESLQIRDLRDDSTSTVEGVLVDDVAVMSHDAVVMAVERVNNSARGVLIDAATGDVITRTPAFLAVGLAPVGPETRGFVLQAADEDGNTLLYVSSDGEIDEIDSGVGVLTVANDTQVSYLRFSDDYSTSELRRWSPGEEPDTLLEGGLVGAGDAGDGQLIASRESDGEVQLFRESSGTGEMDEVLAVPADAGPGPTEGGQGATFSRMWVLRGVVHLQLDQAATSSYLRIDLTGDDSDVPIEGAAGLALQALDVDGTAVATVATGSQDPAAAQGVQTELVVVRPAHDAEVRATVGTVAGTTIHNGVVYLTDTTDPADISVRSVRAAGDDELVTVYENHLLVGVTFPENGGAGTSQLATLQSLIDRQRAEQGAAGGG